MSEEGKEKLFGTDGVRGRANEHPMTAEIAMALGQAIGHVFESREERPRIIIGKDTRLSGYMFEDALARELQSRLSPVLTLRSQDAFQSEDRIRTMVAGYLTDESKVICPSSTLAQQADAWELASLDEIDQASGRTLVLIQRSIGGSYGYSLGVFVNGRHRAPRNLGRKHFALMADAPSLQLAGHRSTNHGGRGDNILFEDGHIQYVIESRHEGDHPFVNRLGWMEAGVDADDAVVAPSFAPPFVTNVSYVK